MIPVFFGLEGQALTADERTLFEAAAPAGYILFRRNIDTPEQLRRLTDSLRDFAGNPKLPILVDQEGGRVARLGPPYWPEFPPAARFGAAYRQAPLTALAAARANAQALAVMLGTCGISVDCLPLLDVAGADTHEVIGDRSFGDDPDLIASLGRATLDGLRAGGVVGVMKHIPGHGRATCDSHLSLPTVSASAEELERDLAPFRRLADAPMAMTAHIRYPAWDDVRCASTSPRIIDDIIRGRCGFDGLLMSDDLGMEALAGEPGCATMADRAWAVLDAGCDIALHCSGSFGEMAAVAEAVAPIGAEAARRLQRAMAWPAVPQGTLADLAARRDSLLAAA